MERLRPATAVSSANLLTSGAASFNLFIRWDFSNFSTKVSNPIVSSLISPPRMTLTRIDKLGTPLLCFFLFVSLHSLLFSGGRAFVSRAFGCDGSKNTSAHYDTYHDLSRAPWSCSESLTRLNWPVCRRVEIRLAEPSTCMENPTLVCSTKLFRSDLTFFLFALLSRTCCIRRVRSRYTPRTEHINYLTTKVTGRRVTVGAYLCSDSGSLVCVIPLFLLVVSFRAVIILR